MRTHFFIYFMILQLIFTLPYGASAGESPQVPAVPGLMSTPSLPSIIAFGTPNPPSVLDGAAAKMPDVAFWEGQSMFWPVHGKISSEFGLRGERIHEGIDIPVPDGTPIQAAAAGIVTEARTYRGYGYTVVIDHKDGTKTLYAHCSGFAAEKGEEVERGQVVAYAGNTGRSTASHLHFGVMIKGAFKDPMIFLKEGPRQFVNKH